ncbi:MAG: thioredoxin family protein [Candidatus Sungbacteria bacterium]|nr:thioredoxin family protein [Candidatus Sungbacteria bacterium]
MQKITIYTTPTCAYCKMTNAFFKEHNVTYEEKDMANNHALAEEVVKKSGRMAVPVIDIDGKILVGFDKEGLSRLLNIK